MVAVQYISSIEKYLGPSDTRFFGSGYRRVDYKTRDLSVFADVDGAPGVRGSVEVTHPADWSIKSAGAQRPHLSTIDALILGARLAGVTLKGLNTVSEPGRARPWLHRIVIKAGTSPLESRFSALPVEARHRETRGVDGAADGFRSTFDCRIGNMRVQCVLGHGRGGKGDPEDTELSGDGYRARRQHIQAVEVDNSHDRIKAAVTLDSGALGMTATPSMIDAFVVSLQLGQVLLYELDGVSRAKSNTLWMRTTTVTAEQPMIGTETTPTVATATLVDSRILTHRGASWRAATIAGDCWGIGTECAVAHELPAATNSIQRKASA